MLVSAIQQSGLVIRIHLFIPFHILFPSPSPCVYDTLQFAYVCVCSVASAMPNSLQPHEP